MKGEPRAEAARTADDAVLFGDERILAVVRAPSADAAIEAAQPLWNAGIRVIEITLTVPDAVTAITRIRERCRSRS